MQSFLSPDAFDQCPAGEETMDGVAAGIVDSLLSPNPAPPLPPDASHGSGSTNDDDADLIEAFVVAGVLALSLLHLLGSLRRRSSNSLLHAAVMLAYTQSYALVSYTLGQIMSSSDDDDLHGVDEFPVWAVCLLLLLGGADCLTARSLSEVDGWRDAYLSHLVQGVWVVLIVVILGPGTGYLAPLCPILLVACLRAYGRVVSLRMVGEADRLCESVKPIADYMQHEHRLQAIDSGEGPDPVTMEGYRYVVTGDPTQHKYSDKRSQLSREDDTKITTVEQIWRCRGSLLRSERGMRLKDVCLSMALSRMLNRRFAGFPLAEAGLEKTHDLVFRGLLAGDKRDDRAFRIVEVELAFVHDIYYTRYPFLYNMGRYFALYLPMAMVILCSWLACLLNRHHERHSRDATAAGSAYAGTTMVLMAAVAFMEGFQMYLYMASGWFKVALIRSYVTRPMLQREGFFHMIIRFLLRLRVLRPWQDKLGQYSLLHALQTSHRCKNCLHYVTLFLIHKVGMGLAKGKLVPVSGQVKRAVVDSLAGSGGHLTNGVRSLQINGVHEQLSWACHDYDDGTVGTRAILVWHVATDICKHQLDASKGKDGKQPPAVDGEDGAAAVEASASVATGLSRYCAYLVAFAPSLLPDHRSVSASMLGETIQEARKLLRGAKTMKRKCEKLMSAAADCAYGGADDDDGGAVPLVVLGARLARQLTEDVQDTALRWKVLADFWAEMVLYVAPSDDARAHLEALARGGEFVTHLWALLTHAGVLERGPASGPLAAV